MGKSSKKKRKHRRLLELMMQQASVSTTRTTNNTQPAKEPNASSTCSTPPSKPDPPAAARPSSLSIETPFASRKRPLTDVRFVYPQTQQPFQFTKLRGRNGQIETAVEPAPAAAPARPKVSELSINDILNGKTKQQVKAPSPPINPQPAASRRSTLDPSESSSVDDSASTGHWSGRSVEDAVRDRVGCRPRANSTDGELNLPQRGLCDERKVLEAYQWQPQYLSSTPKGFFNLGNSCFLNSTLQCLAHLPPFCQSLLSMPRPPSGQKLSPGKRLTCMLRSLFAQVHTDGPPTLAPRAIVGALPTLGACGNRGRGYKFRPGRQEDATEFLVHLLDAMHHGELRHAGMNPDASGWRDRLPIARLDETTLVHRVFGGYFRSQVKCTHCGYTSNTYDPFLDLALEVSQAQCRSIVHAMSDFTRKERLDSQNRWHCCGCQRRVCAVKQLTVFRPPLSLCVQLKRFTYGGFGAFGGFMGGKFGGNGGKKITKPIEFPAHLRLPLSDGRSCEYALTGLVIHVGSSASSGHYTAYVKKPTASGTDRWYHADDSYVEAVSERTVLQQRDAYVLFYSRREVKLEFPAPPLRSMTAQEAQEYGRSRARERTSSFSGALSESSDQESTEQAPTVATAKVLVAAAASKPLSTESRFVGPLPRKAEQQSSSSSSSSGSSSSSETSSEEEEAKEYPANNGQLAAKDDKDPSSSSSGSDSSSDTDSSSDSDSSSSPGEEKHALTTTKAEPSDNGHSLNSSELKQDKEEREEQSAEKACHSIVGQEKQESSDDDEEASSSSDQSDAKNSPPKEKSRIVLDRGAGRGKVEVMLGPRFKSKIWKPKTVVAANGKEFGLLGNRRVDQWGDEEADEQQAESTIARSKVVEQMERKNKKRKAQMHLDRWDSYLDLGKQKKVKGKAVSAFDQARKHDFQRLQNAQHRMNKSRGKKGFVFSKDSKFKRRKR